MDNLQLYNKINALPEKLRKEVENFVEELQKQATQESKPSGRVFGSLKGKIHMTEDFDAPIEDFKNYM
jgi:hypothetical protein